MKKMDKAAAAGGGDDDDRYGVWWTAPAEGDDGRLIMVTGRKDVARFRSNPKYNVRVEITWRYEGAPDGMPDEATSQLMEEVTEALQKEFRRDPVAVMTGIFTGDDERNWILYTLSVNIFQRKICEILDPFPLLPITIYTENDPGWEAYDEMAEAEIRLD